MNINNGNLKEAKVGDEITGFTMVNGSPQVWDKLYKVGEVLPDCLKIYTLEGKIHCRIPFNKGGKISTMYNSEIYFSNNSDHIVQAKKNIQKAAQKEADRIRVAEEKLNAFSKELDALCLKYGASLGISFGPGSDTHGIYDETICVSIDNQSRNLNFQ